MNNFLECLLEGNNNPCSGNIEITFNYHQRYENKEAVMGEQNFERVLKIEKNISGNIGYTVSITPSMSPKPMKIISVNSNKIEMQGYGFDKNALLLGVPLDVASFECYSLTLNLLKSGIIDKAINDCVLHLLDRNIDIKYYRHSYKELSSLIKSSMFFDSYIEIFPFGSLMTLKDKLFFQATQYEEYENGCLVSRGSSNSNINIQYKQTDKKFFVTIENNNIENKIKNSFEFDACTPLHDRMIMFILPQKTNVKLSALETLKGLFFNFTRDEKIFAINEPCVGSIFTIKGNLVKISFTFTDDRLIEFYNI